MIPHANRRNDLQVNSLRATPSPLATPLPLDRRETDPDLTAIIDAWPDLPEAIRTAIVTLVKASSAKV